MYQSAKPLFPGAYGIILPKDLVWLQVRTAGASISCYFRVNGVNILRQAADRCKCLRHRAAPVHAHVPVQSSDPLLFAQQWHLNLRTALSFKCQVSR